MSITITDNLDMRYMGLPKWPQMIVRGQPVTLDQAKEIIRRTDRAFTSHLSGNDHKTVRNIAQRLGLPASMYSAYDGQPVDEKAERDWQAAEEFRALWGTISTEYVTNNWVSSSFIYGPHGWCHPDGTISYDHNVGKWPDLDDIIKDWDTLATAFPFLDVTITLMNGESCEDSTRPVVTLKVKDGNVTVCPPEPAPDPVATPDAPQDAAAGVVVELPGLRLVNPLNQRAHWRTVSARGKREKADVAAALRGRVPPALPVVVTITRVSPGRLDSDGCVAAAKHARDAVALWLGADDADARIAWRVTQAKGPAAVRIAVGPMGARRVCPSCGCAVEGEEMGR